MLFPRRGGGKCEAAPCKKHREAEPRCAKSLCEDEAQQALEQALAMQRMQAQMMMQNMQAQAMALAALRQAATPHLSRCKYRA